MLGAGRQRQCCPWRSLERQERDRWVAELVEVLIEVDLPVVAAARSSLDPAAALRRCAGGRRGRTLRQRIRSFRKFLRWTSAAGYDVTGVFKDGGDIVLADYLNALADEPCGRTVPQTVVDSVAFFEGAGGVPASQLHVATPGRDVGEFVSEQDHYTT